MNKYSLIETTVDLYLLPGTDVMGCTGCQYCMPCPIGVNIPLCFEGYNNQFLSDNPDLESFMYAARLGSVFAIGKPEFASLCVESAVKKAPNILISRKFSSLL
jgi:predicted aldo/keto reductase-like oxidoreductase